MNQKQDGHQAIFPNTSSAAKLNLSNHNAKPQTDDEARGDYKETSCSLPTLAAGNNAL
ncbi:MAG TPA: hypothetical protein VFO40_13765 [Chthoniobacterales bacterium]|nr:hypothetical protein [Chthoniobacterales bacterium]